MPKATSRRHNSFVPSILIGGVPKKSKGLFGEAMLHYPGAGETKASLVEKLKLEREAASEEHSN